jgi:hypothetical protein
MHIANSRGRDGFRVAQDFRKPKGGGTFSGGVVDISERAGLYCLRVIDRGKYGHYETEEELAGDMLGPIVWEQDAKKRPIPGWMHAWPVVGSGTQGGGGDNVSGGTSGPGGEVPPDSRGPITGTGNANLDAVLGRTQTASGGQITTNMIPLPPKGLDAQPVPKDLDIFPLGHATGAPKDDRFLPKKIRYRGPSTGTTASEVDTSRKDGTMANLPRSFPAFARGTVGIVLPATVESEQVESFHPTDPRLIAPNRAGAPGYGSVLCDMTAEGEIDEDATALLQSAFRVVLRPRGSRSFEGNSRNTIAINIGRDGQSATVGSLVADGVSGKVAALGRLSVRDGGPLDCVAGGCQHTFGADGDGNKIGPVHFSDLSLWRTAEKGPTTGSGGNLPGTKGGRYDGPMHFETPWPDPPQLYYPSIVRMGFDEKAAYRLPRDGGAAGAPLFGKYKWWTTCVIGTNGPRTPTGRRPDDPDDREPRDPPPPPEPGGPTTPGGDNPGGPGTPGGDTGGGPGSPGGDGGPAPGTPGGDNNGGPTTPGGDYEDGPFWEFFFGRHPRSPEDFYPPEPSPGDIEDIIDGFPPPVPGGGGRGPTTPGSGDTVSPPSKQETRVVGAHKVTPGSSSILKPRVHAVTVNEFAGPSIVGRPQIMSTVAPDLRYGSAASAKQIAAVENGSPHVIRSEAFGKQDGGRFTYTQTPGKSRSLSGTGTGGVVELPPEHDMTDVAFNSAYGDTASMAGASSSSRVIGYGVTLAWGKPSVTTGKPTESVGATADYANKSVQFAYYDAGGTGTDIVEIKSNALVLADQVDIQTNTGTGTIIATSSSQKLGFFGTAATTQPAAVADAAGGAVIDDEARTAINTLLARLRTLGLIDT